MSNYGHERIFFGSDFGSDCCAFSPIESLEKVVHLQINPNAKDWKFLHLPPSFFIFYYLLRPIRLTRQYVSKSWKGIKRITKKQEAIKNG